MLERTERTADLCRRVNTFGVRRLLLRREELLEDGELTQPVGVLSQQS